jgi:hypothetical protein
VCVLKEINPLFETIEEGVEEAKFAKILLVRTISTIWKKKKVAQGSGNLVDKFVLMVC